MTINYQMLGKRIKDRRKELGLSQERLAELAELSIPHMSHIETGKTKVSLSSLVAISNALGVTVDALLFDSLQHCKSISHNKIADFVKTLDKDELLFVSDIMKVCVQSYRNLKKHQKF